MKARRLKRLRIKRVDLVERGANQEADVVLFKSADVCKECGHRLKADEKLCPKCNTPRDEKKAAQAAKRKDEGMPENVEQIKKLQDDLKAATDLADEESKKREAVEKALKEQGETIATLKKRLDESEAEIKKAQDAARLVEFKKTVDAFEHLPVKADVFAPILKKCSEALDEAGFSELMRVLKAADSAGAGNFIEIGAPGAGTDLRSAAEELDAKAEELVAKGMKKPDAIVLAAAQNPKLAARARREAYSVHQES